jgi:hypothetical protein
MEQLRQTQNKMIGVKNAENDAGVNIRDGIPIISGKAKIGCLQITWTA